MKHVLWIGGPPAAGKTTIATRLARRHGLRLYSADTRTWEHRDRALAAGNPAALRWEALPPAERWDGHTDAELLAMSLHRERGAMVLDDLRALPDSPLIVAEGSTLPAWAANPERAVWLVPGADVLQARLTARGTPAGPARLYGLLRDVTEEEAREHGIPVLDASDDLEERFGAAIAAGPQARTRDERCALLREINDAIAAQVRGYYARPWAHGDPETVVREFVCECGDPACDATLTRNLKRVRPSLGGGSPPRVAHPWPRQRT